MITAGYVRAMAAYNAEMNRRVYAAADRLGDARRREDGGAFWGSIHRTLNHILWADRLWMSRFAGSAPPPADIAGGTEMFDDFPRLAAERAETDALIGGWAEGLGQAWLESEMAWFSGLLQREIRAPAWLLVAHLFNHQTHHRGQAHALITRFGERIGDTDLFLVVPPES